MRDSTIGSDLHRSGSGFRAIAALGLGTALATVLVPLGAEAQVEIEVSTGILVDASPSVGDTRVGPLLSLGLWNSALGLPLFLEAAVARTDFTSLRQDYHHNYYLFVLGAGWSLGSGPTRLGLRLGLGAVGEYEVVEISPAVSGGDNWIETVVPGFTVEHELDGGVQLVAGVSDYMLNPFWAILDPEENDLEHRWRVTLGVRF